MRGLLGSVLALSFVLGLMMTGCAHKPKADLVKVKTGDYYIMTYDASVRGAYIKDVKSNFKVCAEPPPDVAYGLTSEMKSAINAKVQEMADVDASTEVKLSQDVVDLAKRGQALQIQREAMYRLCELYANGGITDEAKLVEMFGKVLSAIQGIAAAEVSDSNIPEDLKRNYIKNILD